MSQRIGIRQRLGVLRSLVIYYGQPWRRRALKRFYSQLIKPGDLAFDIGAHVGSRSKTLLDLGAKVVAVEPQPAFSNYLNRHFRKRLTALEIVAVGAEAGETVLHLSSLHPTVTSISRSFIQDVQDTQGFRHVVWDQSVTVPVTTLDALIQSYGLPAFCKIDVEGAEADIVRGLSKPIPLIAFEYIPASLGVTFDVIERLSELGPYSFRRVLGETHHFHEAEWIDASTMRKALKELEPAAPSGDIYARLDG